LPCPYHAIVRRRPELSELQLFLTPGEIRRAVDRLASQVRRDYEGKNPIMLGALKGSFMFMADLVRSLDMPLEVEFVTLSSYGRGRTETSGKVKLVRGLRCEMKGRHVVIVEDIVDTGRTLSFLLEYLRRRKPTSVRVCALFDKAERREVDVPLDYVGFSVPDAFVVGYGLDYDERYRQLPGLYLLKETGPEA